MKLAPSPHVNVVTGSKQTVYLLLVLLYLHLTSHYVFFSAALSDCS